MIITRTPLRLPLGGGGTDLPAYYRQFGGELTSLAINKYMYIVVKRSFDKGLRISYAKTENVKQAGEIEHPIVREVLNFLGLKHGLEIVSISDVPANTGLGSSGSFTVGLLLALHTFLRQHVAPEQLAEESFMIQAEKLGEPIGKQDEYMAAFGGVTNLKIDKAGRVKTTALPVAENTLRELEHNLLLFYTGQQRKSSDILGRQQQDVAKKKSSALSSMHYIKQIGQQITAALELGQVDNVGRLMHEHWVHKQRISSAMAPDAIRGWYDLGCQHGATGGKLVGAGGGGFLLFYCAGDKSALRRALTNEGLVEMPFSFDHSGAKVVINMEEQAGVTVHPELETFMVH